MVKCFLIEKLHQAELKWRFEWRSGHRNLWGSQLDASLNTEITILQSLDFRKWYPLTRFSPVGWMYRYYEYIIYVLFIVLQSTRIYRFTAIHMIIITCVSVSKMQIRYNVVRWKHLQTDCSLPGPKIKQRMSGYPCHWWSLLIALFRWKEGELCPVGSWSS